MERFAELNISQFHPMKFLNQACAGHSPVHAWFLKIDPVRIVGMRVRVCVCVRVSALRL